ncbi:hypothetical protein F511_34552 [Dorcoceras hygrometricum]|uniref:Uncharacterized protein n=1 Tax=Dorcoceras hygrometricum TaxID=472368 RepID=A0A2Z7B375_9LAMI|nr:hypothetical protein F511_34552 [Dorcoceras hygrometricum]
MMNSRRICPADGSKYKKSAVGLVFMESAAGLAMETSKVGSAVRSDQQMKRSERDEATSCWSFSSGIADDVIGDVIIFSRWFERAVARISRRKQQQHPVVSFNESAVATHPVVGKSSRELQYPVAGNTDARKEEVAKRCIQSKNESAAKQLTTYEELSKLDVNC